MTITPEILNQHISRQRDEFDEAVGDNGEVVMWPKDWCTRHWPVLLEEMVAAGQLNTDDLDEGFILSSGLDGITFFQPGYVQGVLFAHDEPLGFVVCWGWLLWKGVQL